MPEGEFEGKVSVITCDMTGTVQQYAADAEELFGWPRDRVIGRMSVAAFHLPKNVPTLVPRLLREAVESQLHYRAAALVLQPALRGVRRLSDYAEYGGVPLLGVAGTVIMAHGRSDARAIKNAIRAAQRAADQGVVQAIQEGLRAAPTGKE